MQTVVVLGGVVAELSAANELIERGFEVEVYETLSIPGGRARSIAEGGSGDPRPIGMRKSLPDGQGLCLHARLRRFIRQGRCAPPARPSLLQTVAHAHASVVQLRLLSSTAMRLPAGTIPPPSIGLRMATPFHIVLAFWIRAGGSRWLS